MVETMIHDSEQLTADRKKRLVIIVDSDASRLSYTGMLLQRFGYNIYTTKTAEDAFEVMNIGAPSLVLTDVFLTAMSGLELLQKMKQIPHTQAVPVLFYTQSLDRSVKETCLREGGAAFLNKPADPDALFEAIQKATEIVPRRYIRLSVCLSVFVDTDVAAEGSTIDCLIALSEDGMYISTLYPRMAGIELPFTIFLQKYGIRVTGKVLHSYKSGEGPLRTAGMGIKFIRIKPEDRAVIRAFINRQLLQDLDGGAE
jgi:twitching motility two-component system response regulator PilH